jgi:hypothetical protein
MSWCWGWSQKSRDMYRISHPTPIRDFLASKRIVSQTNHIDIVYWLFSVVLKYTPCLRPKNIKRLKICKQTPPIVRCDVFICYFRFTISGHTPPIYVPLRRYMLTYSPYDVRTKQECYLNLAV